MYSLIYSGGHGKDFARSFARSFALRFTIAFSHTRQKGIGLTWRALFSCLAYSIPDHHLFSLPTRCTTFPLSEYTVSYSPTRKVLWRILPSFSWFASLIATNAPSCPAALNAFPRFHSPGISARGREKESRRGRKRSRFSGTLTECK